MATYRTPVRPDPLIGMAKDSRFLLLLRLVQSELPCELYDNAQIIDLMSLQSAGLVLAVLPEETRIGSEHAWSSPATVQRITRSGEELARRIRARRRNVA